VEEEDRGVAVKEEQVLERSAGQWCASALASAGCGPVEMHVLLVQPKLSSRELVEMSLHPKKR
jgi:hypothetical protein